MEGKSDHLLEDAMIAGNCFYIGVLAVLARFVSIRCPIREGCPLAQFCGSELGVDFASKRP